jgi:pimeloyl-ACP methyl ester carboxylesterase
MSSMLDRRRMLALAGSAALLPATPIAGVAQEARLQEEPWSSGHLAGTLVRPQSAPPRGPAAVLIAGSGPSTRDGTFGTLRQIAHGIAQSGIRSLRYDKRGVGQSRPLVTREDELVLRHFVDDALLAARDLAARSDVSSVFMIGHSEGAMIATLAAAKMQLAGIALLAGIGRRLDVVIREQLLAMPLPPTHESFRKEGLEILDKLSRGERVDTVSQENAPLFRPSVQPFLLSVFAIDPAAELAKLTLPVLLARGQSDIQVSAVDLELLSKARPDARVLSLPETNHVFKPAPADTSDRAAQLKSYDTAAPLVPQLISALAEFINSPVR